MLPMENRSSLLYQLKNLPLLHAEKYVFLRGALAQWWLNKQHLTADFAPDIPADFLSLYPRVENILADRRPGLEGTRSTITPEIIALISEKYAPGTENADGVFYTPFATARHLSQETLLAWLKLHHFVSASMHTLDASQIDPQEYQRLTNALTKLTICDPACGAGGLLIAFWLELADLLHAINPQTDYAQLLYDIAAHNLYGVDINPHALDDLRLRMGLTLAAFHKPLPARLNLMAADALAGCPPQRWKEHFPGVFERGGFDIYVANPPYIGQKNHKEIFTALRENPYWQKWLMPKSDLLYLFFHLAFDLLAPDAVAGLLTTAYFTQAAAAKPLRQRLQEESNVLRLIDFGNEKLFTDAQGQHNLITIFTPQKTVNTPCICGLKNTPKAQEDLFSGAHIFLDTQIISADLKSALGKMAAISKRLKDCALVSSGLMTGYDPAFILTAEQAQALDPNRAERRKLKPLFKNSDIFPYATAKIPRFYLIDIFYPRDRDINMTHYPHFAEHLAKFKKKLLARKQNNNGIQHALEQGKYWFGSVRRKITFEDKKLVLPHRARKNICAYAPGAWYASSDVYFITQPGEGISLWYLLALLNSKPYYAWLFYNGKRKGNLLELYAQPLGEVPIPDAPPLVRQELEQLAQQIHKRKLLYRDAKKGPEQTQIDNLVCTLFNFTLKEKQTILSFTGL